MKKSKLNLLTRMILGILFVAVVAAAIWGIELLCGVKLLSDDEGRISNYLELMGISFSVTFITTSLFGGLSDKSEKIYWLSYPETYLIDAPLNFMVLSSISFLCLGIQAATIAFLFIPERVREAVFLSSFIVGIVAIVVLSYKFTAVFFSRKKLVKKAEEKFDKMVKNNDAKEMKDAIVGLFNNTLEAAMIESNNFARVSENIKLLLKYNDNDLCNFWLRKLVVEIARNNASMLSQLVLDMDGDKTEFDIYSRILENIAMNKDSSVDCTDVLYTIYDVRLKDFKRRLGGDKLFDDFTVSKERCQKWDEVARELNAILSKIDTSRPDNCVFVLKNLQAVPYDLLKNNQCIKTVIGVWENILKVWELCIKENDTFSYQNIQKLMYGFLYQHAPYYFNDEFGTARLYVEQLADELHRKTADVVSRASEENLVYMIDVIEEETEKQKFIYWLVYNMSQGEIPLKFWKLSKEAPYNVDKRYYYSNDMKNGIFIHLLGMRKAVVKEYKRLKDNQHSDIYTNNLPLCEYLFYLKSFTKLLINVATLEKDAYTESLKEFITVAINDVCVGEANSYEEIADDFYADEDYYETVYINSYVNIFRILIAEKGPLSELRTALELNDGSSSSNYFENVQESKQKKEEMLFFLKYLVDFVKKSEAASDINNECILIMTEVLTNPCVGPVSSEKENNPEEVNESIELIGGNKKYIATVNKYISEMNEDMSLVYNMYQNASNYQAYGEPERAEKITEMAQQFEECLEALGKAMKQEE